MNEQSAFEARRFTPGRDVDEDVRAAMYMYLRDDLGLPEDVCQHRSATELERGGAKNILRHLSENGVEITGKSVLDVGAGLGAMSEELILQGAHTFAIEPGAAWASIADRRASRHGEYDLRSARGEQLPFGDSTMDVAVSLQVLEHVQDPEQVLAEVFRVLKPGGYFYLACENYLAFREGHYRVFWLPLLPKPVGGLYLRLRGRSPQFLYESVTYVTFPQITRWSKDVGFIRCRDDQVNRIVDQFTGPVGSAMRLASRLSNKRSNFFAERVYRTFKFGIRELFRKPIG